MSLSMRSLLCIFFVLTGPAALLSCSVGPQKIPLAVKLPEKFTASGSEDMPEKWWTAFGDQMLNQLNRQAFEGNYDLKGAWARLNRARALTRLERAPLWPELDASASLGQNLRKITGDANTIESRDYSLRLSASYELDVWGRIRAQVDAAHLEVEATAWDVKGAALSLSGQITSTWYQLVERRAQLNLLNEQVKTNENYLDIVRFRFQKGEVSAVDVLQQQELLESTRTDRSRVKGDIEVLQHRLAVLIGQIPGQVDLPSLARLPNLPPLPKTGMPANWIRQRPDIYSAYLRVKSADREIAAAIADQYPRFSLTASLSTAATDPADLFKNWLANIAGNLLAPLLDGGRRKALVKERKAAAAQALQNYSQTVLLGIEEVENALSSEKYQKEVVDGLKRQLYLSNITVEQLVNKYRKGNINFLRVLDELRTHQRLEREFLQARGRMIQFRIDLYRALGRSWEVAPPEGVKYTDHSPSLYEPPLPQ